MIKKKIYSIVRNTPFLNPIRQRRQIRMVKSYMLKDKEIKAAEKDPEKKKIILKNHRKRFPKRSENLIKDIKAVLDVQPYSNEKKASIAEDMFFYYYAYGFTPYEYEGYGFETKSKKERLTFESERGSVCYGYRMNDINSVRLLSNKNKTYELLHDYFKRDAVSIKNEADKDKFYEFIKKHKVFVRKLVDESCGRSVEKVDSDKFDRPAEEIFKEYISQGENILEELVVQNEALSKFNSSSVNTIRCITLRTSKGVDSPFCFMKVGRAGAFVDNGGAGGILVGIDEKTGILNTDGYDELNRKYDKHPDSGIVFKGYQLPEWDKMISMCKEMSNLIPGAKSIGWDTAYTDEGWVVIEGNALTEVIGPQTTTKKGIRKSLHKYL